MNALLMAARGLQTIVDAPVGVVLLLKITAVLLTAWTVHLALRRLNPRWRVLLWRVTAVGLIALPVVGWLLPALKILVEPRPTEETAWVARPESSMGVAETPQRPDMPFPPLDSVPSATHVAAPATPFAEPQSVPPNAQRVTSPPSGPSWLTWRQALFAIWLGGMAILVFRWLIGHYRIGQMVRRAEPPPQWVRSECLRVAQAVDCRSRVDVLQSALVQSPLLCGLRRPVLLLPPRMCEDSYRSDLPAIFAHELTHVRFRDLLWNAALHLISIVLWFHPLAWRLRKAHLAACELVCDAVSANFVGNVTDYCRTLARVAVESVALPSPAGIAMARTSNVSRRLNTLKRKVFHAPLRRRTTVAFGLAALLTVGVIGALQFAHSAPPQADQEQPAVSVAQVPTEKPKGREGDKTAPEISVKPGFRPMQIRVFDSDRKPIADVTLTVRGMTSVPFGPIRYPTNQEGLAVIEVPREELKGFQILAWDNRHVTLGASWHGNAIGAQVPEKFTFVMEPGTVLGGIVRDDQGKPVVGAEVTVEGRKTTPGNPLWVSVNDTATTDAEGKWQVHRIPKDLVGFDLEVKVKRPNLAGIERFAMKTLSIEKLRTRTAEMILRKGIIVEGKVNDPQGRPAAGATVGLFPEPGFRGDSPRTKTDHNGHYRFAVSEPGEYTLAAAAKGYAPDSHHVTVGTEPQKVDLQLRKGEMIRLRVVDKAGKPMPQVVVGMVFDSNYRDALMLDYESAIERDKDRHMLTDAEGRWSRLWIPKDELTFYISKPGYAQVIKKAAPSDQEYVVTLEAGGWSVTGRVVDQQTKAPVMKFRVVEGRSFGSGDHELTWHESRVVEDRTGQYRAAWNTSGDSHRVLRIEADGYLPSEARRLNADERQVTFDVELSKGQGIVGTVRAADKRALANAEVALCTATRGLYLQNGRPLQGQPHLIVRAGPDGRFAFPPQREPYFLVAFHDRGFAQVEDQAGMKDITLQPWARAEGTLRIGGKPRANESITINYDESPPRPDPSPAEWKKLSQIEQLAKMIELGRIPMEQIPQEAIKQLPKPILDQFNKAIQLRALARRIHLDYRAQTDSEGHFVFERVRPGKAKISHSIKLSQEGMMSSWTAGDTQSVEFIPGQTVTVNLVGVDPSVVRQRDLAAKKMRKTAVSGDQTDPARENQIQAALKVLSARPPASQDDRTEAAIGILRNYYWIGKDEKTWATAIRELITIGKPAVPKLIAELDRAERHQTLRALGFVLRGIGDPRAVPALIRSIPRLYLGSGSDFGLRIPNDPDLMAFMKRYSTDPTSDRETFSFGRPIREIMSALEKITGQSHGWMEFIFAQFSDTGPEQERIKRLAFLKHAERWADWWSKNWNKYVANEADAQLNLTRQTLDRYAESIAKLPHRKPLTEIPFGPQVVVSGGATKYRVPSFDESPWEAFLDFDSGRRPNPAQELVKNSLGGEPSKELLAWAEREGVDLITVKTRLPGSDKPAYAFMPLKMRVWRIDNDRFDNLQNALWYGDKKDLPAPWTGPMAQVDEKSGKFDGALTVSFLFITKEGTCGAFQIQSPIRPPVLPGMPAGARGGWTYRFIYERNPEEGK